jgi:hypothetical protein
MRDEIHRRIGAGLALVLFVTMLGACTTGEVLSGAAGGAAGYVIGRETADDDD